MVARLMNFGPDALVMLITQKDRADNYSYESDDDRKGEAGIDVSGSRDEAGGDDRQKPTEPAIAEVVRQGERRVSDLGGESFDKECRDRPVNHRHENNLDENKRCERN